MGKAVEFAYGPVVTLLLVGMPWTDAEVPEIADELDGVVKGSILDLLGKLVLLPNPVLKEGMRVVFEAVETPADVMSDEDPLLVRDNQGKEEFNPVDEA